MSLTFRDPDGFARETVAVSLGAAVAGFTFGPASVLGIPLPVLTAAVAMAGGSAAAAIAKREMKPPLWQRVVLGVVGGATIGMGHATLADGFGLGGLGVLLGGAFGGAGLAMWCSVEEKRARAAYATGVVGGAVCGAVGAVGLLHLAAFATSEAVAPRAATTAMAALYGLWVSAGAGLRRLEPVVSPLVERSRSLLEELVDPLAAKLKEGMSTWTEVLDGARADGSMSASARDETVKQADLLVDALLETSRSWHLIHRDLQSPRVRAVADKIADHERRITETSDTVTRGHLARALAALHAQRSAIDGLRVGLGRAEAAVDAQLALLERLRLAVAQHRVSDRERFDVELTAVAEQTARLSDDIDALSAAVAEAEALADRRTLADLERGARKAIDAFDVDGARAGADDAVRAVDNVVESAVQK